MSPIKHHVFKIFFTIRHNAVNKHCTPPRNEMNSIVVLSTAGKFANIICLWCDLKRCFVGMNSTKHNIFRCKHNIGKRQIWLISYWSYTGIEIESHLRILIFSVHSNDLFSCVYKRGIISANQSRLFNLQNEKSRQNKTK